MLGSATRRCVNGEWEMAQVLECESSGFVSALTEVSYVNTCLLYLPVYTRVAGRSNIS